MSELMDSNRPAMVKSADTLVIENRLRAAAVGELVSYDELSELLGRDVREYCRGNLRTAEKSLQADGYVFAAVIGKGVQRLSDEGKLGVVQTRIHRAKRQAKTAKQVLAVTEFSALDDDHKKQHLSLSAVAGVVEMFCKPASQKRICDSVKATDGQLAIGKTLELFGE